MVHHLALLGAISNTCSGKLANLPALMEHRLVVMQDTCVGYDANRVDTARWCRTSFDCLVDAQHSGSVSLQWEKESIVDYYTNDVPNTVNIQLSISNFFG